MKWTKKKKFNFERMNELMASPSVAKTKLDCCHCKISSIAQKYRSSSCKYITERSVLHCIIIVVKMYTIF